MRNSNGATKIETQFSVFLANRPNLLAQICQRLASDHLNIVALTMMDATEHGVLRLVFAEPDRARETLRAMNIPTAETQVLVTILPNRPGAMADIVERLASHHIALNYAYCTTGAAGGRTLGIFRVSDFRKALQVLEERRPRRKLAGPAPRADLRIRRG